MKRQADGIRLNDDTEQTEENGTKRIKLLNNEINKENLQMDHAKENTMMDVTLCKNSHDNDYEDQSLPILNNVSPCKNVSPAKVDPENNSIQNVFETKLVHENVSEIDNCNGPYDEPGIEISACNPVCESELHHTNHLENSVPHLERNTMCNIEQESSTLNHSGHDQFNNNLTDSFHTEDLHAENTRDNSKNSLIEKLQDDSNSVSSQKHAAESSNGISEKDRDELSQEATTVSKVDINHEILEKHAKQSQDNNLESEFSFDSNGNEIIDLDNLTLSQLKVVELLGHTEEILCVGADEDYILSSSADTTTKVWNMERQNVVSTFSGHSNSVTSVLLLNPSQSKKIKKKMSLTKVSRIAITGSLDCHIKLWSVLEGKELASVYTFNGITCLGYLESECLVVVGTEGGKLELWNLSLKEAIASERAHEDKVTDIKVIDNYIYSVSVDGTVKAHIWSYEDEDLYPIYSRKRKEYSSDKNGFRPAEWKTVAIAENILYLGDSTNNIKMLDWRVGRLSLFKNQINKQGVCNSIVARENALFSSSYDSFTKTSSINVWKLPEMSYVCTLTGAFSKINNIAVVQKDNKLKIITGGDKLYISEFDFSKPSSSEGEFFVCEYEILGHEINENPVEIRKPENNSTSTSKSAENNSSSNKWCNIM